MTRERKGRRQFPPERSLAELAALRDLAHAEAQKLLTAAEQEADLLLRGADEQAAATVRWQGAASAPKGV